MGTVQTLGVIRLPFITIQLQVDIDKQKQYGCEDDTQVQYKHEQVKIKAITGTLVYNR